MNEGFADRDGETAPSSPPSTPTKGAPSAPSLPPDPAKYDHPRNVAARRRGLEEPYIAGGEDPDLATTLRGERRMLRWLIAMVVVLVLLGFVLGIAAAVIRAIGS